jgi:hypothetical protein
MKNQILQRRHLLFSNLLFLSSFSFAQIEYTHNADLFDHSANSSFAIGFTDVNGDYQDDLILTPNGNGLHVYNNTGADMRRNRDSETGGAGSTWTLSCGDLDGNGHDDILLSGAYTNTFIFDHLLPGFGYRRDTFFTESVFAQGSNFVDINNDGFLDIFICHDDGNNLVYINDGTGNMNFDVSNIEFPFDPSVDNSGNYGSEWVDFDDDGDLDLYIAKCRLGVTDTADIRRINALYVNDGNNLYTEQAEVYGLNVGWQSWASQFGDVDNDGDLDLMVANHDYYHQLFRNEDGVFVEDISYADELIEDYSSQLIMQDFDNDGDLDVMVSGDEHFTLWNDGTGHYIKEVNPLSEKESFSIAAGDFNNDGFIDVLTQNSGPVGDRLYNSIPNGNNYVKISLNGTESNKEGIGAKVLAYGPLGVQRRDIKAGESYGITNTSNAYFGLGQTTSLDSVIVEWPFGIRDVNLIDEINRQYLFTEGNCATAFETISYTSDLNICPGESVRLVAETDSDSIIWSNGMTGVKEIDIFNAGIISYKVIESDGCVTYSDVVYITNDSDTPFLDIELSGDVLVCGEEPVFLGVDFFDNILWSTGETTTAIAVTEEGWYSVEVINNECIQSDSVFIYQFDASVPVAVGDTISSPGVVNLSAVGDSIHWYTDEQSTEVLSTALEYNVSIVESRKFYATHLERRSFEPIVLGEESHSGTIVFGDDNRNEELFLSVEEECILKSVDIFSDLAGTRKIVLKSAFIGGDITSEFVFLEANEWTTIPLNFSLPPGFYGLATDGDNNLQNLGHSSPRLAIKNDSPASYPYEIPNLITLNADAFDVEDYFYFYNMQIEKVSEPCESERVEVDALIDESSSIDVIENEDVQIFPNPAKNTINIFSKSGTKFNSYSIKDMKGRVITTSEFKEKINIQNLQSGTYILELHSQNEQQIVRRKIAKI